VANGISIFIESLLIPMEKPRLGVFKFSQLIIQQGDLSYYRDFV